MTLEGWSLLIGNAMIQAAMFVWLREAANRSARLSRVVDRLDYRLRCVEENHTHTEGPYR